MRFHLHTILLDTNVWLDYFLPSRTGHHAAQSLVGQALANNTALMYPIHALPDIFYFITIDIKNALRAVYRNRDEQIARTARTTAWECVNTLRDIAVAVGADQGDAWLACSAESIHDDVEDNLVLAAARRSKADILVTNDKKLLSRAPLLRVVASSVENVLPAFAR